MRDGGGHCLLASDGIGVLWGSAPYVRHIQFAVGKAIYYGTRHKPGGCRPIATAAIIQRERPPAPENPNTSLARI